MKRFGLWVMAATLVCGARSLMAHYANYMKSTG